MPLDASGYEAEFRRGRLEALKGDWRGFHSIRINDQWRVVFRWDGGHAAEVRVVDYH